MNVHSIGAIGTPLGRMVAVASERGLTSLGWSDARENDCMTGKNHIEDTRVWVGAFFEHRFAPPPKLDRSGLTAFQDRVLGTLSEIAPFGRVVSYGGLASASGSSGASRAVGSVMAGNPWALVVPCHRVVRSDGGVGDYSGCGGGVSKMWLLDHEGNRFDSEQRLII